MRVDFTVGSISTTISHNHCDTMSKLPSSFVFLSIPGPLPLTPPPPNCWPPPTPLKPPSCQTSLPALLDPLSSRPSCSNQLSTLICRLLPPWRQKDQMMYTFPSSPAPGWLITDLPAPWLPFGFLPSCFRAFSWPRLRQCLREGSKHQVDKVLALKTAGFSFNLMPVILL